MSRSPGLPERIAAVLATAVLCFVACGEARPPRAESAPLTAHSARSAGSEAVFLDPRSDAFVISYAGDRGVFTDTNKLDDVQEEARGLVRVVLLSGPKAPAGQVWVTNLRRPDPDGRYRIETVPRSLFEELALGQGRRSSFQLPNTLEPPEEAPPTGGVIVYKTDWCGVCKQLTRYLDRKGVAYVAKDIEKDQQAAAELQAKARAKGFPLGSVPVIDVGGELMVGFDRGRLEQLL
ncbi:MAG: glutaredoxin family protein [Nannocystaceae bacterium]